MKQKEYMRLILWFAISFVVLFLVFAFLSLWGGRYQAERHGVSRFMINGDMYTRGVGAGTRTLPDNYEYVGKIKHVHKDKSKPISELEAFGCRKGDKLYSNNEFPEKVFLYDRYSEKYIPYTSSELQQLIVSYSGSLYIKESSWFEYEDEQRSRSPDMHYQEYDNVPEQLTYVGRINTVVHDQYPDDDLQMATADGAFLGLEVYIDLGKDDSIYLVEKTYVKYNVSEFKFFKYLQNSQNDTYAYTASDKQAAKLQKLCKVWGFAKYTHQAFLTGEKDWDEELLSLIPIVQTSDEDEVNDILYNWFLELGDDGYELNQSTNQDMNLHQMADMSWINKGYLGQPLAGALSEFHEIQIADRKKAPVSFDQLGNSVFSNEKTYEGMDYSDSKYRLIGLFRLWNAMEYYFPYMDILDDDWNELLFINISKMLKGTDKISYEQTLASLASKLHDAHITFFDRSSLFDSVYGSHIAPVLLAEIEGHVVVTNEYGWRDKKSCPMKPGDIVLRLNGAAIEEIATDMLQYLSYPNEDKALSYLLIYNFILRQKTGSIPMEVDVLRDGAELSLTIDTVPISYWSPSISSSHLILESNIGVINPSKIYTGALPNVMKDLAETNGLIVDMRQYPGSLIVYKLADYLLDEKLPFVVGSAPFTPVPGVFVDVFHGYSGPGDDVPKDAYYYEKNVVLLVNERTLSQAEFTVMSLRNGANVTVMGSNTIGADGNVTFLPLPGRITMSYTGLGIYTPEGDQTQRIGLPPDIYVEPTITGVRDGIDELMETAINYLISLR